MNSHHKYKINPMTILSLAVASIRGSHLNIKMSSYQYKDPHVKDNLIFNMEIPIPGKDGLYIETGPLYCSGLSH